MNWSFQSQTDQAPIRHTSPASTSAISALNKDTRPQRRRPRASYRAADELRMLRGQAISLEEELRHLQLKWMKTLPDERILATAQHTAYVKHKARKTMAVHNELHGLFLQQQIIFATLQSAIFRSPLSSHGTQILKELHFDTRLGQDSEERSNTLTLHSKRSLTTLPAAMERFTQLAVDRVQEVGPTFDKPQLPISQIDITGCENCTLISSVFITEVPHASLEDVYAGVLAYFDAIPVSMKRHFGVDTARTRLNRVNELTGYWQLHRDGAGFPTIVNHVVTSELTQTHGIIHVDALTGDPLYPSAPFEFDIKGITIAPRKDPMTDKNVSVTLRWVVLYRYILQPDDPALQRNLEMIRPILNGDLITASVCNYIQKLLQQRSQRN
ncbi:unnamed protein product [Phytophthora lilii]|uniref:Unnamed protein product n=1 Tax=Phytophthora lilii TaxID=2077276 RepID=A0A9W6WKJ7_9STRA|nr:unnamed protein product [Phytophthora lilii]